MVSTSYITKEIAARILGVSPRRALELCSEGKIRSKEGHNPQTKRRQTLLVEEDVRRLAAERTTLSDLVATAALPHVGSASPHEAQAALQRASELSVRNPAEASHISAASPVPRNWLTLDEAAACGLPASYLLSLIESGELPARNVGVRPGGRWRIRRADLEQLEGVRRG